MSWEAILKSRVLMAQRRKIIEYMESKIIGQCRSQIFDAVK